MREAIKILTTPIAVAVHPAGCNPIFGDQATHVVVDDYAGGPFIVIRQFGDHIKEGEVRLDMDELEAVVSAARQLIAAQTAEAK